MNKEKIKHAIIELEEIVVNAEELHEITSIQYDSFVEGGSMAETSRVYKTTTSIIEHLALKLYVDINEKYKELYSLIKEE
jgi:hypothetical protein